MKIKLLKIVLFVAVAYLASYCPDELTRVIFIWRQETPYIASLVKIQDFELTMIWVSYLATVLFMGLLLWENVRGDK